MKKRILVILMVVILSSISITNVFAYGYCSNCGTYSISEFCGNTVDHLTGANHVIWDSTYEQLIGCNYTLMYYKNLYVCGQCDAYYYASSHIHSQIFHERDPVMNGVVCTMNIY